MKRLLFIVLLLLAIPAMAADWNVTFQWDYVPPMPSGFEITYTMQGQSPVVHDCGAAASKTCLVSGMPAGSGSAYVRAYNIGDPPTLKSYSAQSNVKTFILPTTPLPATTFDVQGGTGTASLTFAIPVDQVATITLSFAEK